MSYQAVGFSTANTRKRLSESETIAKPWHTTHRYVYRNYPPELNHRIATVVDTYYTVSLLHIMKLDGMLSFSNLNVSMTMTTGGTNKKEEIAALPILCVSAPPKNVTFAVNYELPMVNQFVHTRKRRRRRSNASTTTESLDPVPEEEDVEVVVEEEEETNKTVVETPGRRTSARDKNKKTPVTRSRTKYDMELVPAVQKNSLFLDSFDVWWKLPSQSDPHNNNIIHHPSRKSERNSTQPRSIDDIEAFLLDPSSSTPNSVIWIPESREQWEDTISEMTAVCTSAAIRRHDFHSKKPFVPPLSRDYIRDRIDIDVRKKTEKMQIHVLCSFSFNSFLTSNFFKIFFFLFPTHQRIHCWAIKFVTEMDGCKDLSCLPISPLGRMDSTGIPCTRWQCNHPKGVIITTIPSITMAVWHENSRHSNDPETQSAKALSFKTLPKSHCLVDSDAESTYCEWHSSKCEPRDFNTLFCKPQTLPNHFTKNSVLLGLALFVDTVNLNRDKQSLICQFKDIDTGRTQTSPKNHWKNMVGPAT
jgi:hypothetical protein